MLKSKNLTGDSCQTIDFTAFPDFTKFNQTADYHNVITNARNGRRFCNSLEFGVDFLSAIAYDNNS